MSGDFSRRRNENARRQGYSGVLMQQGRLYTDSDWNENLAILAERSESVAARLIGASGTPKDRPGFAIAPAENGFSIGTGSYWVDGLRVENFATVSYAEQGGLDLEPLAATVADGGEMLIHLVVEKDEVSALADPRLADPALSGVDTAVRERARWRVAVRPVQLDDAQRADLQEKARKGVAPDFADWRPGSGRMRAGTSAAAELPEDECLIPPDAGYLSQENQLYRVQIVRGGDRAAARFVWSRENGSVEARLARNADGEFILTGARADEALGFVSGGFVEIYDDRDVALSRPGTFARITLGDGVASFTPAIGDFTRMVNPRVRRWDHAGTAAGLPLSTAPTPLERGIEIAFTDGSYAAGDCWLFEARAATGGIIWPPYPGAADMAVPPMGWGRRQVPLALARRSGNGISGIVDLRAKFPALNALSAEDIRFHSGNCRIEADNVRQAIELLCARGQGGGLCTAVVRNSDELQAAVAALTPGANIRLCLAGAAFPLPETLRFQKLGHVVIEGTGPQTIISVAAGEAALLFEACASVQVRDLSVNGGPVGHGGNQDGRRGALAMIDCGDIGIERVRARCRTGPNRAAACISSIGRRGKQQQVRIRDCMLKVGQAQIGIQIIGASRAIIADNQIQPLPARAGVTRARIATDRRQRLWIARGILRFSNATATEEFIVVNRGKQTSMSATQLNFAGKPVEVALYGGGSVSFRALALLADGIVSMIGRNDRHRITSATEMRRTLRNRVLEAIANNGRATIAGKDQTLLPKKNFQLAETPFLAQGIVIGGDRIDEVQITGNRIEDANDGIRIAASGRQDPILPRWRDGAPANRAAHLLVAGNNITLNPLSSTTPAHGIFIGHAARVSVRDNSILLERKQPAEAPHHGILQHGWRGPLLVISENQVGGMTNGIAVIPTLDNDRIRGVWRLRDNGVFDVRNEYVLADGVDDVS